MENKPSTRIHPLVAGAAISVMLVSLTGVAAITGLIPNSHSTAAPAAAPVAAAAPATTSAPAALVDSKTESKTALKEEEEPAPAKRASATRTAQAEQPRPRRTYSEPAPKLAQAPACYSCGRVESVQAIQQAAQPSGVGMVAGAVLGGVLGNQVGGGNGRKIATVAGAVGGGYAGNEIERRTRSTTTYQVRVRMEGGEVRTFPYSQQPAWSVGDRVRVVDGQLTSRA